MILPQQRYALTKHDINTVSQALGGSEKGRQFLQESLEEGKSIDDLLDVHELFSQLLKLRGISRISPQLFFYVGTKHELHELGYDKGEVIDYVASMLTAFVI